MNGSICSDLRKIIIFKMRLGNQFNNCIIVVSVCIILCTGVGLATSNNGEAVDKSSSIQDKDNAKKNSGTELTHDPVSTLLLVSTLDGSLTALDRLSGQLRWISKDEPMIRVPMGSQQSQSVRPPFFLPDPRSGALYILGRSRQLKKLPFTIPQLVSMAPCRSTEGLLYTGKKMDVWLSLNPFTGEKADLLSYGDSTCPAKSGGESPSAKYKTKTLLIGKSEYTVHMVDGPRKWNVTFHDYSSVEMNPQSLQDYDLVHFTSPSTGAVLTYERESGELLWQREMESPVIAFYSIDCTLSTLLSVPFTSIATETLDRLKVTHSRDNNQLSPTLYVGECAYGLYAVPSLVDDTVLPISAKNGLLYLIEGPKSNRNENDNNPKYNSNYVEEPSSGSGGGSTLDDSEGDILLLGHYEMPEAVTIPARQITSSQSTEPPQFNDSEADNNKIITDDHPVKTLDPIVPVPVSPNKILFPPPPDPKSQPKIPSIQIKSTSKFQEGKSFVVFITIALTSAVISVVFVTVISLKNKSKPMSKIQENSDNKETKNNSRKKSTSADGLVVTIGKISFEPTAILGKGCEGTFVFKGKFEDRDVAVKRILPECFAFADREVDLLKESDQHVNVIRYFCTESDGQFRYIALELCLATLSDWVEGKFSHESICPLEILKEATDGLAHLHSLRIVHRDVKPANVLLTVCPSVKRVRTMISDFGLCKKLTNGRMSFSRRSGGMPGTEGWIAPEVVRNLNNEPERMTYSVDIFSLGCVYYYVLTNGDHPFGDPFRRQLNILSGEYSLEKISSNAQGAEELIRLMISADANARPPLSAVLSHPIFWSKEKCLAFFLDVSDRIEKENENTCRLLMRLEQDAYLVVRKDWRDHICPEVAMDLRKYRTYKGHSVRDLLRALRNKKNHYRELTPEAQASLGQIPDQFVLYWLNRFPSMLPYVWKTFECVKTEPIFSRYYPTNFSFSSYPEVDDDAADDFTLRGNDLNAFDKDDEKINNFSNTDPNESPERKQDRDFNRAKIDKNFWRSKSQYKYNKWRRQPVSVGVSNPSEQQSQYFIPPKNMGYQ